MRVERIIRTTIQDTFRSAIPKLKEKFNLKRVAFHKFYDATLPFYPFGKFEESSTLRRQEWNRLCLELYQVLRQRGCIKQPWGPAIRMALRNLWTLIKRPFIYAARMLTRRKK